MKRIIDLSIKLKTFDGKSLYSDEKQTQEFTLKDGLLGYIRNAPNMGLSDSEQNTAFVLGYLIGPETGKVELTTDQYDCLKKLADNGKIKTVQNQEVPLYPNLEIKGRIKELVDDAPQIEEKKEK